MKNSNTEKAFKLLEKTISNLIGSYHGRTLTSRAKYSLKFHSTLKRFSEFCKSKKVYVSPYCSKVTTLLNQVSDPMEPCFMGLDILKVSKAIKETSMNEF